MNLEQQLIAFLRDKIGFEQFQHGMARTPERLRNILKDEITELEARQKKKPHAHRHRWWD